MALVSSPGRKPREVPDFVRELAHKKLDEALNLYEAGRPLWINTGMGFASTTSPEFQLDIYIKEWL